jgi:uncharacterized protein involved in outer membrane biogenesis
MSAQESSPKYMHVSGRGTVDLKAIARGEGADAILKTLNGKFGLNGADGRVRAGASRRLDPQARIVECPEHQAH